ncbi:HlyD family efflux transporter periplasmic adaptor subunit [uncultured Hoeflea sp.]|uniref:HlyD family secretion protein n=1 Tax=uncultured Hoeflea sp. TaxID=538666 RepID=UPI0030DD8B68
MQRIKKRPSIDAMTNHQRVETSSWSRRIYFILLGVLLLAIGNYLVGDMLIMRAEGIVLSDRNVVAATYQGRVADVRVREGEAVAEGDILLRMESPDMLRSIADLAARNADLDQRLSQMKVRSGAIGVILPLAERRADENMRSIAKIDELSVQGLVASTRMDEALASRFDSAALLAELAGEADLLQSSIPALSLSVARSAEALIKLEEFYSDGNVRAPRSGVVGSHVPVSGEVAKVGDELLKINGNKAYILAFLPDTYLFDVRPGDPVTARSGNSSSPATVEEILGVADALPPEFQNMFRPRDRSRLVRISIPEGNDFAVTQKVTVGGCIFGWCWNAGS